MSMRIPLALLLLLTSGAVLSADGVPAVFAPGVVSTGDDEWGFTMTADGGTVILQTDVTEIILAERHERGKLLDDQARMIRATLDHINQGVAIFDAEARLAGWNRRLGALLSLPMGRLRIGASFEAVFGRLPMQFEGLTEGALREWIGLAVYRLTRRTDAFFPAP